MNTEYVGNGHSGRVQAMFLFLAKNFLAPVWETEFVMRRGLSLMMWE
jgi:hypothetical protein